eukprot:2528435-Amphidinium_carterae.1
MWIICSLCCGVSSNAALHWSAMRCATVAERTGLPTSPLAWPARPSPFPARNGAASGSALVPRHSPSSARAATLALAFQSCE